MESREMNGTDDLTPVGSGGRKRRLRFLAGPMILAFFQVAPVPVERNEDGRLSLAFGFGAAAYDQALFTCNGEKTYDRDVSFSSVTGIFDYIFPGGNVRATGVIGAVNASTGPTRTHPAASPQVPAEFDTPLDATILGALIGWEARLLGIQGGVMGIVGADSSKLQPSIRARIGPRERWHGQIDLFTVHAPGQLPMSGLGVALRDNAITRELSAYLGVGAPMVEALATGAPGLAVRAGASIPIGSRTDVTLGATFGDRAFRSFGAGVRLHTQARVRR